MPDSENRPECFEAASRLEHDAPALIALSAALAAGLFTLALAFAAPSGGGSDQRIAHAPTEAVGR